MEAPLATIAEQGKALEGRERLISLFKEKQKKLNEDLAHALALNAPLEGQLNYLVGMKKDSEKMITHLQKQLAQLQEAAKLNEGSLGYYIKKNNALSDALEDCRTKLEASMDQNLCGTDKDSLDLLRSLRTQIRVLECTNREQSDIIESRQKDLETMTKLEKEITSLKKSLTSKEQLLEVAARAGKDAGSATVLKYAKEIKKLKKENEELRGERVYEECRGLVRLGMKVGRLEWENKQFRVERLALFEGMESFKEDNERLRVIIERQGKQLSTANMENRDDAATSEKLLEDVPKQREKFERKDKIPADAAEAHNNASKVTDLQAENNELRAAVEAKNKDLFDALAAKPANNSDDNKDMNNAKGVDKFGCNDISHADLQDENAKLRAANDHKDKALFSAKSFDIEKLIEMNLLLLMTIEEKNKKLAVLAAAVAAAAHDDARNGGAIRNSHGNGNGKAEGDDDILTKLKAEIETPYSNVDAKDMQGAGTKPDTSDTTGVTTNIIIAELNTKNQNLRLTITQKESQNKKLKSTLEVKDKELANTKAEIARRRRDQDGRDKEHAEIKEYLIAKVQRLGPKVAELKGVVKEYEDVMLSKGWMNGLTSQFAELRARKEESREFRPKQFREESKETKELIEGLQKEIMALKMQVDMQGRQAGGYKDTAETLGIILHELKKMMAEVTSHKVDDTERSRSQAQNSAPSDPTGPNRTERSEEGISIIALLTLLQSEILPMKQQLETQGTRVGI